MISFMSRRWPAWLSTGLFILMLVCASASAKETSSAEDGTAKEKVPVGKWLFLGPINAPFPAFNDEDDKSKMDAGQLLGYEHLSLTGLWPVPGQSISLTGGASMPWREISADTSGVLIETGSDLPQVVYLACYIEVPRWMKIDIEARGTFPFELLIDQQSVIKREKSGDLDKAETGEAKLEIGKHLVVAKTVRTPGDSLPDWRLDVRVAAAKDFEAKPVLGLDPGRMMTIDEVLNGPAVRSVMVSPDGRRVLLSMTRRLMPDGKSENWMELRQVSDGKLLRTMQDQDGANWAWVPAGNRLSYVVREDDAATVRILDLDTGAVETIVRGIKDFSSYTWSPDASYFVYSVQKEPEKDKTGVKRLLGPYDRRHYERNKSSLYLCSVPSGLSRRLTAGEYSANLYSIHPDCQKLLIGRSYEDLTERPYSLTEMIILDLETQQTELLYEGRWLGSASWSPDGSKILITAGPSSFGDEGKNVPAGIIPNDYDTQAYIFDPETKAVDPITRTFSPTVEAAYWPPGRDIYMVAEETEYTTLYRYNPGHGTYKKIELPYDVMLRYGAARTKPVMVASGCGVNEPYRVYSIDLKGGRARLMFDPTEDQFEHVRLGSVADWNFITSEGKEIVGRIYYPPNFDESRTWPCIVYYYGGTSPVNRAFGGRYPKNLWAAGGYVVYVLQPSGATGFGQKFSAKHVNDWGKITAGEIIEGTRKFLSAHSYVDPKRVGCIGASYGGFMTQLVITKTDLFAAAVSHAGISSIMSYWGEGYWGYLYNAVSAAESFPWNRPDIYVDQSPLNAADKITTPLLLLHGTADTNVPPGESEQMYTALKLLGKEVEYLRIDGQNHFIIEYKKRVAWSDAILGWFDKWLKEQPEWWDDMYPPLDEEHDSGE